MVHYMDVSGLAEVDDKSRDYSTNPMWVAVAGEISLASATIFCLNKKLFLAKNLKVFSEFWTPIEQHHHEETYIISSQWRLYLFLQRRRLVWSYSRPTKSF